MRRVQEADLLLCQTLGSGGYGDVCLYKHKGRQLAVKRIFKQQNRQLYVSREVQAGKELSHKNIAKFYYHFEEKRADYLVFEYVKGSNLFELLQARDFVPFTNKESRKIFLQLAKAIYYSHNKGVVHLDVKLDNIMVDPKTLKLKLIDFGLCNFVNLSNFGHFCTRVGSEDYWPAEFELVYNNNASYCGVKVDVWCMGIVLYCLLNAKFPYDPKTRRQYVKENNAHPPLIFENEISRDAQDLLQKMLEVDPDKRIDMERVMNHPWLKPKLSRFWEK